MIVDHLLLIVKLIIGFSLIVTYLSLTGKTQLSNMTAVDYIGNFVIGGAIGGTIYSGSSLGDFVNFILTLIITLLVVCGISFIVGRFNVAREITVGVPLVIIRNGTLQHETINENSTKIDFITVLNKLHLQGIMSLDELDYLQIQPTGELVAMKKGHVRPSVMVYNNGKYNNFGLEEESLDQAVIDKIIEDNHVTNIVFIEYYARQIVIVTDKERLAFKL